MHRYEHIFYATVTRVDYGRMAYHGVFLPDVLLGDLPAARKNGFRIKAEVAGVHITCGLMAVKKARYILLSNAFLKQADIKAGDEVCVKFSRISSDHVDVPYELELALSADPRAKSIWSKLTPGKQRGYAHQVATAMQEPTRNRRSLHVVEQLMESNDT